MRETDQAKFNGWARVEVMGHQTHIGLVTTEAFGGAILFRIDQPEIPETEETLERSEWSGSGSLPAGTVVKRGAIPGVTVFVGVSSIYRIIPCTEGAALKAIRESERRPVMVVRLPESKAVAAGTPADVAPETGFSCCGGDLYHGHMIGCPVNDGGTDPDGDDEDDDAG